MLLLVVPVCRLVGGDPKEGGDGKGEKGQGQGPSAGSGERCTQKVQLRLSADKLDL